MRRGERAATAALIIVALMLETCTVEADGLKNLDKLRKTFAQDPSVRSDEKALLSNNALLQTAEKAKTGEAVAVALMAATALLYSTNSVLALYRRMKSVEVRDNVESIRKAIYDDQSNKCIMFREVHFQVGMYEFTSTAYVTASHGSGVAGGEIVKLKKDILSLQRTVNGAVQDAVNWSCRGENLFLEDVQGMLRRIENDISERTANIQSSVSLALMSAYTAIVSDVAIEATSIATAAASLGSEVVASILYIVRQVREGKPVKEALSEVAEFYVPDLPELVAYVRSGKLMTSFWTADMLTAFVATVSFFLSRTEDFVSKGVKILLENIVASLSLVRALTMLASTVSGLMEDQARYENVSFKARMDFNLYVEHSNANTCTFMDRIFTLTKSENDLLLSHQAMTQVRDMGSVESAEEAGKDASHRSESSPEAETDATKLGMFGKTVEQVEMESLSGSALAAQMEEYCLNTDTHLCFTAINQPVARLTLTSVMGADNAAPMYAKLEAISNQGPISTLEISTGEEDAAALRSMGYTLVTLEAVHNEGSEVLIWYCRACTKRAIVADSVLWYGNNREEEVKEAMRLRDVYEKVCNEKMTVLDVDDHKRIQYCTVDRKETLELYRESEDIKFEFLYDIKISKYMYGKGVYELVKERWDDEYMVASSGHSREMSTKAWNRYTLGLYGAISGVQEYKHLVLVYGAIPDDFDDNILANQFKNQGNPVLAVRVMRGVCEEVAQLMKDGWSLVFSHEITPEEAAEGLDPLADRLEVWVFRSFHDEVTSFSEAEYRLRPDVHEDEFGVYEESPAKLNGEVAVSAPRPSSCSIGEPVDLLTFLVDAPLKIQRATQKKRVRDIEICLQGGVVCASLNRTPGWKFGGIHTFRGGIVVEIWVVKRDSKKELQDAKVDFDRLARSTKNRYEAWKCNALHMLCDKTFCNFAERPAEENAWAKAPGRTRWAMDAIASGSVIRACTIDHEFRKMSHWPGWMYSRVKADTSYFYAKDLLSLESNPVASENFQFGTRFKLRNLRSLRHLRKKEGWGSPVKTLANFGQLYNGHCRSRFFFGMLWKGAGEADKDCTRRSVSIDPQTGAIRERCDRDAGTDIHVHEDYLIEVVFDQQSAALLAAPPTKEQQLAREQGYSLYPQHYRTPDSKESSWTAVGYGKLGGVVRLWVRIDNHLEESEVVKQACETYSRESCGYHVNGGKFALESQVVDNKSDAGDDDDDDYDDDDDDDDDGVMTGDDEIPQLLRLRSVHAEDFPPAHPRMVNAIMRPDPKPGVDDGWTRVEHRRAPHREDERRGVDPSQTEQSWDDEPPSTSGGDRKTREPKLPIYWPEMPHRPSEPVQYEADLATENDEHP